MADLGYVDHGRLLRLKARGVHVLMRLKASQDPRITRVRVGRGDVSGRRDCPTDGGEDRYYLTTVPLDVLAPDEIALTYTLRWEIELLWKHLKTVAGLAAIRAWRPAAVAALVHAKITAVALARLLELAAKPATGDHAIGQLAIVLTLNRAVPMILALRLRGQNVDLVEMERRMILLATILGRSVASVANALGRRNVLELQQMLNRSPMIEGACRHLVRDRLDCCGARWSVAGAEAVLKVRALKVSGDFDAYWRFHLEREHERNHASRYADGLVPDPIPKPRLRLVK